MSAQLDETAGVRGHHRQLYPPRNAGTCERLRRNFDPTAQQARLAHEGTRMPVPGRVGVVHIREVETESGW